MSSTTKRWKTSSLYLFPLFITPLFFSTAILDVFNTPKALLFVALTVAVATHFFLGNKQTQRATEKKAKKPLASILIGISLGISLTSFFSDTTLARALWGYPGRANGLLFYFALFLIIWIGANLVFEFDFPRRLNLALHSAFLFNVVYGLIQNLGKDPISWVNPYDPIIGTFGNPNFAAAFLGLAGFFYFYLGFSSKGGFRIAMFAVALLATFLSLATNSVQGPAVLVIGLFLLLLHWVRHHISKLGFIVFSVSSSLVGVFTFLSLLGFGPLGEKLFQYTLDLRLNYWLIGVKTALHWPITGVGTDSYVEGFKLLRGQEFVNTYSTTLTSDAAHSAPINFLANFGFINFFLLLVLILWITLNSMKNIYSIKEIENPRVLLSVLWICLLVQSLFSIEQIGLSVFQWMIGAILLNHSLADLFSNYGVKRSSGESSNSKKPELSKSFSVLEFRSEIALVVFLIAALLLSPVVREELNLKRSLSLNSSNANSAGVLTDIGAKLTYISRDEVRRGMVYVEALFNAGRLSDAQEFLRNLVKKDPQAIDAWESLARLERYYGKFEKEVEIRKKIESLDPFDIQNLLDLSIALKESGNASESVIVAKRLLSVAPSSVEAESATAIIENKGN